MVEGSGGGGGGCIAVSEFESSLIYSEFQDSQGYWRSQERGEGLGESEAKGPLWQCSG